MKILFASPEVSPFAKTGGLGDVSGSLPGALSENSCDVTVILPFYRSVKGMNLELLPFSVEEFHFFEYKKNKVKYVFVSNDDYYDRDNFYSEPDGDYNDNDMRFSYFSKAVVAFAAKKENPALIHCNDWQTGLVPLYLKLRNSKIKTLFTIHNIGYQGLFPRDTLSEIGIPEKFYHINSMEYYGKISFLKSGIVYSSAISTVSRGYAKEILTPEFGCGMDGILKTRSSDIYGIVNGADYAEWDPEHDKHICCNYNSEDLAKKEDCKKDLIKHVNLPPETLEKPLIGVISRLAEQKGVDLIVEAAQDIADLGASIVLLGTGDEKYNKLCRAIGDKHPGQASCHIKFDNTLAHKIEAGCDLFAMPSRYEPCGLNQLYSMRYGTLPVVRKTGGLDDTIVDLVADRQNGNGIKFSNATKNDLVQAVSRAIEFYKDKELWHNIQKRIMKLDFSWEHSAKQYTDLYRRILTL